MDIYHEVTAWLLSEVDLLSLIDVKYILGS